MYACERDPKPFLATVWKRSTNLYLYYWFVVFLEPFTCGVKCIQKHSQEHNIRVFSHICAQISHNVSTKLGPKNINNKMFTNFQSTTIESDTKLHIGQEGLSMLDGVYLSGRYTGDIFQSRCWYSSYLSHIVCKWIEQNIIVISSFNL